MPKWRRIEISPLRRVEQFDEPRPQQASKAKPPKARKGSSKEGSSKERKARKPNLGGARKKTASEETSNSESSEEENDLEGLSAIGQFFLQKCRTTNEEESGPVLRTVTTVAVNTPQSAAGAGPARTPYRNVGADVQPERPLSYVEANNGISTITERCLQITLKVF